MKNYFQKPLSWWQQTPLYATRLAAVPMRQWRSFLRKSIDNKVWREQKKPRRIWLDVGAHQGEYTLRAARRDAALRVYAFEANLTLAAKLMGRLPNYVVLPLAVAEHNGAATFHINELDGCSSLLPLNPAGLAELVEATRGHWEGEQCRVLREEMVPTIRLDTFLDESAIKTVDFLKIDVQGGDFAVVKSLGERLADVKRIRLEVATSAHPIYQGSASKTEVVQFMQEHNFALVYAQVQSRGFEENRSFVNKSKIL